MFHGLSHTASRLLPATLLTTLALPFTLPLAAAQPATAPDGRPQLIAHRAGTTDAPENTRLAIRQALKNGVDAIWITLQLSRDQIPVLYRPSDLKALTNGQGPVSAHTAQALQRLDAAWKFAPDRGYPLRGQDIGIPSLADILKAFPDTHFYLDMKSPDADPETFAQRVHDVVKAHGAGNRVRVYSTNQATTRAIEKRLPAFASRDLTRSLLSQAALAGDTCPGNAPDKPLWHGFELNRKVKLVERFTLGEGTSEAILTWSPHEIRCFNRNARQHIILFGIRNAQDYQRALALKVDGVMVDSPRDFRTLTHGTPDRLNAATPASPHR